jgi:hypothetical protein
MLSLFRGNLGVMIGFMFMMGGTAAYDRLGPRTDSCAAANKPRAVDYVCDAFARMSRRRSKLLAGQTASRS